MVLRSSASAALVCLLLASSGTVSAQSTDARELFLKGVELADEQRWGEAIEYFRRSRAIEDRPSTMFNMGVALLRAARYNEALGAFDDFLEASDPQADAAARAEVTRMRNVAQTSRTKLTLTLTPAEARVAVDGRPVEGTGEQRIVWLDPGPRQIRVEARGYVPQSMRVSAMPQAEMTTQVELIERDDSSAVAEAPDSEPAEERVATSLVPTEGERRDEEDDGGILTSPIFWTVTGVVLVGAGVGLGVGLASGGGSNRYGGTSDVILSF